MTLESRPKRSVKLTRAAVGDLDEAFAYVNAKNRSAAVALLQRLQQAVRRRADFPELGAQLPAEDFEMVTPGIRFLIAEPYAAFYRESAGQVVVLRILHSRRDYLGELLG